MSREIPPTRRGYEAHEAVSALQKAIRRSQLREAVYWTVELDESGYTNWAWKRVKIICSEDVGPAAAGVAADVRALFDNWKDEPRGTTGGMYLVHAVLLLANAPKSRAACWGTIVAGGDHHDRLDVPEEALDRHTRKGLRKGRGGWDHFLTEAAKLIDPQPGALAAYEQEMAARFEATVNDAPGLPDNPFQPRPTEPGHKAHITQRATSEQLTMDEDDR